MKTDENITFSEGQTEGIKTEHDNLLSMVKSRKGCQEGDESGQGDGKTDGIYQTDGHEFRTVIVKKIGTVKVY